MQRVFKYILISAFVTLVASMFLYFTYRSHRTAQNQQNGIANNSYLFTLNSEQDFRAMEGEPLSAKFNDAHTVKIVYDLKAGKIFFINSQRYKYHYDFCTEILGCNYDLSVFNSVNYGSQRRDYLLANLNHYEQSDIYTLEFSTEDGINSSQLHHLYTKVYEATFLKDRVKIFLSSNHLTKLYKDGGITAPVISPTEVYNGQSYQALNKGTSYGYLRIVNDLQKEYEQIRPYDIIIIKGTPVSIPICAGIITDALQTPLSHINVLCHNRNIASAADVNILSKEWIREYAGKPVMLIIDDDSISIALSTKEAVNASLRKNDGKPVKLAYNINTAGLIKGMYLDETFKNTVGNKAIGLGILYKIAKKKSSEFYVPEGAFAIPFYYYNHHMADPSIRKELEILFSATGDDAKLVKEQLKKIRKAIKAAPIDTSLISKVTRYIVDNRVGNSYRFRSSSNAEDMKGFSGAGLYDSKTGILGDTAKSIEEAIKDVWASTWNEQAYMEREWFNIDQRSIMMGIIAHRNFPDEAANGVAITKNIYRNNFPGFTINVQKGEVSVVSPPQNVTCEQFICMRADEIDPLNHDVTAEYLTYSSINDNKPVLDMKQITLLFEQLVIVNDFFYYHSDNNYSEKDNLALDIEFKFEKDGKLYIKQVRPYQ